MATHPSWAWRIPWVEEPGGLRFRGREKSDTPERTALYPGGPTLKAAKALKTPTTTAGKGVNAQREPCPPPLVSLVSAHFRGSPPRRPDDRFALGPGWFHPAFAGRSSPASVTGQGLPPSGKKVTTGPALPSSHRGLRGHRGWGPGSESRSPARGVPGGVAPPPRLLPASPSPRSRPPGPPPHPLLSLRSALCALQPPRHMPPD